MKWKLRLLKFVWDRIKDKDGAFIEITTKKTAEPLDALKHDYLWVDFDVKDVMKSHQNIQAMLIKRINEEHTWEPERETFN